MQWQRVLCAGGTGFPLSREASPAQEREPFQQELPGLLHSLSIRAPVLEAVVGEVSEELESLAGGDIPVPLFFDFSEKPRLDECPSAAKTQWASLLP